MHLPDDSLGHLSAAQSCRKQQRSLETAGRCIGALIELFAEVLGAQRTTCDPTWRPAIVYIATILAVGVFGSGLGEG